MNTHIAKALKAFIYFSGIFLIAVALWTQNFFGKVTIDQTLSTLDLGLSGAFSSDSVYVKRFFLWCIVSPIIITFAFMLMENYYRRKRIGKFIASLPVICLLAGFSYVTYQYSILTYLKTNFNKPKIDYYQTHFVDPKKITFHATHPKSLVLIYVESLESTYANKETFGEDLIHDVNHVNANKISFKSYKQMPGTGWTIAGMISTQCGVPLKLVTVFGRNQVGKHVSGFLPSALCLSDILAANGYKNVFLNGPSLKFAGVDNYLESHHYTEIYGKHEWFDRGYTKADMNAWGLPDDELFKNAEIKLAELIKQNQPFNLTILTIDTHGPGGLLSKTCQKRGYHDFPGIVRCTSEQLAGFINHIKQHGWLDKLNIVIVGDHLAMVNPVYEKLAHDQSRSIFNMIITKEKLHKNTDEIVHFDMFPTIMESLGFQFEGGRLGLGYSGISKRRAPEEENRVANMQAQLDFNSKIYNQFWLKPST